MARGWAVKGSVHAGVFPLPVWTVPALSRLETGHLELKRPVDTCVKCILPLPAGNNWSLEKVLTYCHLNGSETIPPAEELHCVSHRPTHTGQNSDLSRVNGTFVVGPEDETILPAVKSSRGNKILFLHNLRHASILEVNTKVRGFSLRILICPWRKFFSPLPVSLS